MLQPPRHRVAPFMALLLLALGCGGDGAMVSQYETVAIHRGDLVSTISSTGTLNAVGTVNVGTQVSGKVLRVLASHNSRVEAGDLLAVLDTETLDADVRNAKAGVDRATANVRQALADVDRAMSAVTQAETRSEEADAMFTRMKTLYDQRLISNQEFLAARSAAAAAKTSEVSARSGLISSESGVTSAKAALASSEAALAQSEKNRSNAEIRSPISGVIIDRTVDAGQTVAASFSTPTLFVIAQDLVSMEIHAQVDESDVGLIEVGQPVQFSVAAHPAQKFDGVVRERRLKPATVQNVVNYTVVVTAANKKELLLPGMTATVDFQVGRWEDVLLVASAALRFEPSSEVRAAAREAQRAADGAGADSGSTKSVSPGGVASSGSGTTAAPQDTLSPDVAELWLQAEGGGLRTVLVRVLASDGVVTAIEPMSSSDQTVKEGLLVVTRSLVPSGPRVRFGRGG